MKYGNPGLVSDDKWVAVEFKDTLLRVGTPWADCTGSTLDAESYDVGSIMPILFGVPLGCLMMLTKESSSLQMTTGLLCQIVFDELFLTTVSAGVRRGC